MNWHELRDEVMKTFEGGSPNLHKRYFVYIIDRAIRVLPNEDRNEKYFFIMKSTCINFLDGLSEKQWNHIESRCRKAIAEGKI